METINQDVGSSEQCINSNIEDETEILDLKKEEVTESVSYIKQEEDNESLESSATDQQCTQMVATIKEELTDSNLETWLELQFVSAKEEINPDSPGTNQEIEADLFGDGTVLGKNVDDNVKVVGETSPTVNGARNVNGDSDRLLEKNEQKTAAGTPKAIRKRRGRKPRYNRHLSDKPFQCKICQKCFRKPEHLRCHELFHSEERQFLCDTCGKGFVTSGDLKRHGVVHTGEKPYACPRCSKTFTQLCNMQSHLRKRCQPRQYCCDLCSMMFKAQEDLLKHKATHGTVPYYVNNKRRKQFCQDEPPFICDMCSLCFSNKRNLISHIRAHMGFVEVTCQICGKNCARKERLVVHMRSHTGEKPFSCSVCGKAFSQLCNLKKHLALHLPD